MQDAGYVGFTRRHLHQRVDEHRHTSSSIGKRFRDKHSSTRKDLTSNFTILKKCNSKFDCLIYEMFFINELRPSLNVQCDSIRANVFFYEILANLMFEIRHRNAPGNIQDLFQDISDIHSYNTRSSALNNFYTQSSRPSIQVNSFSRIGTKI